eukprot:GEMP01124192.1.p1 GENE.GEMP01124192.1~~GEMP01124192.1.p1  ORF type:complete len:112 (+),score=24.43 GEMP01124192.1:54-389(+)
MVFLARVAHATRPVIADLCCVPLGVGVSVSKYVIMAEKILRRPEFKLDVRLHAYGTNIAGEWDDVFRAVRACHDELHDAGVPRITCTMKFGTRTDKLQTIDDKIKAVESEM